MARDQFLFARGLEADVTATPASLAEPMFATDSEDLYIGTATGKARFTPFSSQPFISVKDRTTVQIQSIIDAYAGLKSIFFGNTDTNIYTIDDTLLIPSNTHLVFAEGVTLQLETLTDKPLLKNANIVGDSNIRIDGGIFDVDHNVQSIKTPAIRFDTVSDSYFENMKILKTKPDTYVGEGAFHLQDCNNNVFRNCSVIDSGDEGLMLIGNDNKVLGGDYSDNIYGSGIQASGDNCIFDGITLKNNSGSSISVHGENVKVINNTIIGGGIAGTNAINMGHSGDPCYNSIVSGNTIRDYDGANGIRCNSISNNVIISDNVITGLTRVASTAIGVGDGSKEVTIKGNRIKECQTGISPALNGSIIDGNLVELCVGSGITMYNSIGNIISNNICRNNGFYGISLDANCYRNIINGNQVYDDQGIATQSRGIYISNVDGNNLIVNNFVYGNDVAQITNPNGSELIGNRFSETDFTTVNVTLSATTGFLSVVNENIVTGSVLSIVPTSANVGERQPYINSQTVGSCQITCKVAGGASDTVKLIIR